MALLIFVLILVLIIGLAFYAIDLIPMDARLKIVVKVVLLIIAILLLYDRSGGL